MTTANHVAAYILEKLGEMPAVKLHKLLYYAQAWSLVWDEAPLFGGRIEAWVNGPVVPQIYQQHRGAFAVRKWQGGDSSLLNEAQRETVDAVIAFYGSKGSQWLSDLTHAELPWRQARIGLAPTERGNNTISHESMAEYYGSLPSPVP